MLRFTNAWEGQERPVLASGRKQVGWMEEKTWHMEKNWDHDAHGPRLSAELRLATRREAQIVQIGDEEDGGAAQRQDKIHST